MTDVYSNMVPFVVLSLPTGPCSLKTNSYMLGRSGLDLPLLPTMPRYIPPYLREGVAAEWIR